MGSFEKSVKIMESYLMDFFASKDDVKDRALQQTVIKSAEQMFVDVVNHTSASGAISYYFRFDPAISDGTSGLFYSKPKGSDEFVLFELTDLSAYDKGDVEHVGWFWQPYEAGEPIWMKPYLNQNSGVLMISYVIPMYFDDMFIGIVGMDFDYTVLTERVHGINIYENGFAHLEIDGEVICNGVGESVSAGHGDHAQYLSVSEELANGMTLVLSADYDDIRQIRQEIAVKILFTVLVLSALFTVIAIFVVKKIVDPLNQLTDASVKLSNGDYDLNVVQSNTREIQLLSAAFENMTMRLREREELLRRSANHDSLTGLRNTTAYTSWVAKFDKQIENKQVDFGVVVLDLNDLKKTNDKYGHAVGNQLIIAAANLISDVFKGSLVFRIGGDEFLVVLQNEDPVHREELFGAFDATCARTFVNEEIQIPLRIAKGFAAFDPSRDACFENVFKRADDAMYENKRKGKAESA